MSATREVRREEFAAAALRIVATDGIEDLSVRRVASEAGWSTGALQKVLPTKDALLDAALDLAVRRAEDRMNRVQPRGTFAEQLTALAMETLPLDSERRTEALVWAAFCLRAAHRPAMAAVLIEHDRSVLAALEAALATMKDLHELPAALDVSAVAQAIVALADGFATRLLYDAGEQDTVTAALRTTITHLLQ